MAKAHRNSNGTKRKKVVGRPLQDLIDLETFIVEYVCSNSQAVSISPSSEMVLGGHSSTYSEGYISELYLKVIPDDPITLTKELIFKGVSAVRGGDYIAAKIPRYTDENEKYNRRMRSFGALGKQIDPVYIRRAPKEREEAIEISIILRGEEKERVAELLGVDSEQFDGIIRTDHSVDYERFKKE